MRLRYGYVVKCTGCEKDADGNVAAVHCEYLPDTKSGTPGADRVKVKGNIHWLSARHSHAGEVRLYDRLFRAPHPGRDRDFIEDLNPDSMRVITAQLEPALKMPSRKSVSSSSGTATSAPIAATRVRATRCSTAP